MKLSSNELALIRAIRRKQKEKIPKSGIGKILYFAQRLMTEGDDDRPVNEWEYGGQYYDIAWQADQVIDWLGELRDSIQEGESEKYEELIKGLITEFDALYKVLRSKLD